MTTVLRVYVISWYQYHTTNETLLDIYRYWERASDPSFWSGTDIQDYVHWPRVHYVAGSLMELNWLFRIFPSFSGHLEYNKGDECSDDRDCVVFPPESTRRLRSFDNVRTLTLRITYPVTGYRCIDSELSECLPENVQSVHCEVETLFTGFEGLRWERLPYRSQLQHISLGQGFYPGPKFLCTQNPIRSFSLTERCNEGIDLGPVAGTLTRVSIDNVFEQRPLCYCPHLKEVTLRVSGPFGVYGKTVSTEILSKNPHIKVCHIILCRCMDEYLCLSRIIQDVLRPIRDTVIVLSFSIRTSIIPQCAARPQQDDYNPHGFLRMSILTRILRECEQTYFPCVQQIVVTLHCPKMSRVMHDLNAIRSPQISRWSEPFPSLESIECRAYPYMTWDESESGYESAISVRVLSEEYRCASDTDIQLF